MKYAWHTNALRILPVPQGVFNLTPKDPSGQEGYVVHNYAVMTEIRLSEEKNIVWHCSVLLQILNLYFSLLLTGISGIVGL